MLLAFEEAYAGPANHLPSTLPSGIRRPPGCVPHAQDHDCVPVDVIADDVGVDADKLPRGRAAHLAATVREIDKAITKRLEAACYVASCARIELLDIGPDGLKMRQSRFSPDNLGQRGSGLGQGNSFGVPQESSHSATLVCVTNRPAPLPAMASASRRASSASSGSKIDVGSCSAIKTCLSV